MTAIPSDFKVGGGMHAYINTGSYGTPVWDEILDVGDVTPANSDTELALNIRRHYPAMTWIQGMTDNSVEFQLPYKTGNTDTVFAAIRDAKVNRVPLEFAFMDGPIATPGSYGLRATCEVTKFAHGEPVDGVAMVDVSAKPSARAANKPAVMLIP
jgi:hypothetical protein